MDLRATAAEETVGAIDEGKRWIGGGDGGCGRGAGTTQLRGGARGREDVACLDQNLTSLEK